MKIGDRVPSKKKTKQFKYVICQRCKWVAFQVSRKYAEKEVKTFNEYFDSLGKEKQELYYGGKKSSIKQYENCMLCGGCYHNFRRALKKEIPIGSTVNPIIDRKD